MSAILFDLDNFKTLNDNFGHGMGDRALVRFAEIAVATLRATDIIGRIGGEEFTVILPGRSSEAALSIAERIRATFATASRSIDGVPVKATVSAGVAAAVAGAGLEALLEIGDQALYIAKNRGRSRVHVADQHGTGRVEGVVARIA